MTGRKEKIFTISFCILTAFLLLLPATQSSFLYPCNEWNDANSYFSVGKALFNGKVPYRDVFDQKGMYLYFFYGLAYLLSNATFFGVFVMEIILAAFDLAAILKILGLYTKKNTAFVLAPAVLAVTFSSQSFYWGGSAEEVCLPFLLWGLYFSMAYFAKDYPGKAMKASTLFLAGLLAGMTANIKFTVLGFFFAWMMCIAFSFLIRRDFPGAVKACLIFLAGMAIPFIPWVIYFACHHALYDWYWGYVYINVFVYSNLNEEGPGLFERIYTLAKLLYWVIIKNIGYFIFVIAGVLFTLLDRGRRWLERVNILALCFFLFLGIYIGGSELPYYALPLSVFTALGFALLGKAGEKYLKWEKLYLWIPAALTLSIGFICLTSMNIPFLKEKREDIFLFQFKEIMEETENPTLLNIGCLDAGLYTAADIVPSCKWFQTQTLAIDDVLIEQEGYIRDGKTDYVLARDTYPEVIWENYELAGESKWSWHLDEREYTYYLFRKIG